MSLWSALTSSPDERYAEYKKAQKKKKAAPAADSTPAVNPAADKAYTTSPSGQMKPRGSTLRGLIKNRDKMMRDI